MRMAGGVMQPAIRIEGLDHCIRKLGRLAAFKELRPPMLRGVAMLHEAVAEYPPPPAGSTYRRTGTLGRRWTTRVETLTKFEGVIGNNTVYGPYVQDKGEQAKVHQGRWQTIQSVVDDGRAAVVAGFQAVIRRILNA